MNVHHLELFYYVARSGGISRALRRIPYGIQQPAVSGQLRQLERQLGVTLFQRTPFALTKEGDELYAFVRPFFEGLDNVERRIRRHTTPLLRIAASEIVLRNHLPEVIRRLRRRFPGLRLDLRSGYHPQFEDWLSAGEIDIAITALERKPRAHLHRLDLVNLGLILLIPHDARYRSARELISNKMPEPALISLPATESLHRNFERGLKANRCEWPVAIVASSLDLVVQYVANGYGVGVGLDLPDLLADRRVRVLPLNGFDPIEVAALWRGRPSEIVLAVLDEIEAEGNKLARRLRRPKQR